MAKFVKTKKWIVRLTLAATLLGVFLVWGNNNIEVSHIIYNNAQVPEAFDGFKIVHISDLHNKEMGKDQVYLLETIKRLTPDVIVVTGDLIDRRKYNLEIAMTFMRGAIGIAPVYYVSGNHEAWSGNYEHIKQELFAAGVQVLDDSKVEIKREGDAIEILGLMDPDFLTTDYLEGTQSYPLEEALEKMSDDVRFQILLSHRPELFHIYQKAKIDLVFSGHAHGGQVRLPFIGGIVAPDQGFFPEYTSGSYLVDNTTLVVSRGLGNSIIPVRLFNRPEVIALTLRR